MDSRHSSLSALGVSLTWFSKHKATSKQMLSAVTPPLGKIVYTTKQGEGVKSAVKVSGIKKEPFSTEEIKPKCCSVCPLPPFSNPTYSISSQFLPVLPPFINSLVLLFLLYQMVQLLPPFPSVLFADSPGAVVSGSSGETPAPFIIRHRNPIGQAVSCRSARPLQTYCSAFQPGHSSDPC